MAAKTPVYVSPEASQDVADAFSRERLLSISPSHPDWHIGREGSHAVSKTGEDLEHRIAGVKFGLLSSGSQALVALYELASKSSNLFQYASSQIWETHVQQQPIEESASAQTVDEIYAALINELFQNYRLFFLQTRAQLLSTEAYAPTQLKNELHAAFEVEPLEDGMSHPAELVIEKALQSTDSTSVLDQIKNLCLDVDYPVFSASVLRCLGRQTLPGNSEWRANLVSEALSLDNVEIRDAAVQSTELWDDENLANILRSHDEPKLWLRKYIEEILENLAN